jgi:hypothetical protein
MVFDSSGKYGINLLFYKNILRFCKLSESVYSGTVKSPNHKIDAGHLGWIKKMLIFYFKTT